MNLQENYKRLFKGKARSNDASILFESPYKVKITKHKVEKDDSLPSFALRFFYEGTISGPDIPKDARFRAEGIAGDVVGKAKGYSYGPAFKFEYVLLVPVKGKEMKITFDDWIFKQDDRVAINRATMTKFGIKVAELTVVFVKD